MFKKVLSLGLCFGMVSCVMCGCFEENIDTLPQEKKDFCTVGTTYECSSVTFNGKTTIVSYEKTCDGSRVSTNSTTCKSGNCDESTGKCADVECENNEVCPEGFACAQIGICKAFECTEDAECDNMFCVNRFCVRCSDEHPCREGLTCQKGVCRAPKE